MEHGGKSLWQVSHLSGPTFFLRHRISRWPGTHRCSGDLPVSSSPVLGLQAHSTPLSYFLNTRSHIQALLFPQQHFIDWVLPHDIDCSSQDPFGRGPVIGPPFFTKEKTSKLYTTSRPTLLSPAEDPASLVKSSHGSIFSLPTKVSWIHIKVKQCLNNTFRSISHLKRFFRIQQGPETLGWIQCFPPQEKSQPWAHKRQRPELGERGSSGSNCLFCKHEDLNLIPSSYTNRDGWCGATPVLRWQTQVGLWGLVASL